MNIFLEKGFSLKNRIFDNIDLLTLDPNPTTTTQLYKLYYSNRLYIMYMHSLILSRLDYPVSCRPSTLHDIAHAATGFFDSKIYKLDKCYLYHNPILQGYMLRCRVRHFLPLKYILFYLTILVICYFINNLYLC